MNAGPERPRPSAAARLARLAVLGGTFALAAALFSLDVATKGWAESELRRRGSRSHFDGRLVLHYRTNSGIVFGLFQAHLHPRKRTWLISYSSAVALGVAGLLAWRILARPPGAGKLTTAGLVALLAGAAGNLRDRITRGAVVDFIDLVPWPGARWPAFNLADLYLAVGLVLCLTAALLGLRRPSA